MEKEIKIVPPEGYEIDKENSTFECIKFKPIKPIKWRDREDKAISGYWFSSPDDPFLTEYYKHNCYNYCVFTTKQLAKSASAMAKISQIMANDERFGGVITDEEWGTDIIKYVIERHRNYIVRNSYICSHYFLAFHTKEQRNLFLKENEDLVKDYFML